MAGAHAMKSKPPKDDPGRPRSHRRPRRRRSCRPSAVGRRRDRFAVRIAFGQPFAHRNAEAPEPRRRLLRREDDDGHARLRAVQPPRDVRPGRVAQRELGDETRDRNARQDRQRAPQRVDGDQVGLLRDAIARPPNEDVRDWIVVDVDDVHAPPPSTMTVACRSALARRRAETQ
jgi:hypothetical protein